MSPTFYFDHNMPEAALHELRRQGVSMLSAKEDGMAEADDESLMERASALGRVMVTEDDDFTRITARWQREGREFPGLLIIPQSRLSIGMIVENVLLFARAMDAEEMVNRVEFLPL